MAEIGSQPRGGSPHTGFGMSNSDWFRRTTWSTEDREAFFSRLKRCRGSYNKAQYVRIQAWHLQHASPPDYVAALELLDYFFREYSHPDELSAAYRQKAECLEALGSLEGAVESLRESVKVDLATGPRTTAVFDYAMLVVSHGLKDRYNEVLEALSKLRDPEPLLLFPLMQYQAFAAMAIIGAEDGKLREAQGYAKKALAAWEKHQSGDMYPEAAEFPKNPYPEIHARLVKLAKGHKPFWKLW